MPVPQPNSTQRQILKFFRLNPHAVETTRGIATWLGVDPHEIQEALDTLVAWKWLLYDETQSVKGYTLNHDDKILHQIQESIGLP